MATPKSPSKFNMVLAQTHLDKTASELTKARPKPFLPVQQLTQHASVVSHHITGEDLLRLKYCTRGSLSPWLELAWGAVLGSSIPFLTAAIKMLPEFKSDLEVSDHIALTFMAVAFALAIAFTLLNKRNTETIESICSEIENRAKSEIYGPSVT